MIEVGQKAPDFELATQSGEKVRLQDFHGQTVVLYFYPKDDTPGCTKEACAFRDMSNDFREANTVVLGVSRDTAASHDTFSKKYGLTMPLLADTDGQVCEAYGVLQEKNMYGHKSIGIVRSTFVIDGSGTVSKVYPKVRVEGHVEDVLAFVKEA